MSDTVTVLLTFAVLLALALLVIAGISLSVRAFTTLTELVHLLGSQVLQQPQERQQAQTSSSDEEGNVTSSQTQGPTATGLDKSARP